MKSKIKISKTIIILLMITFIGIAISGCGKTQTKLPLLKLPQSGGFTPHDFEVQLNADVSKLPKQITVYKVVPQKIDEQTVERLCKIFEVDTSAVKVKKESFVVRRQNGKELDIYNDTGFYEFIETKKLYSYFPGKVVPPEEDCIKIAKSFAERHNLLPKMYQYRIAIGSYTTYHPSFNESIVTDRTVTFYPIINGREALGPNIDITIGNKGEIERVDNHLYNIAPLKGDYALKSIDEVIKELKENKLQSWWIKPDEPDVKKVIINKVEIEYYGDIGTPIRLGQLFVQPIYYLSGKVIFKNGKKGKFGVSVPAVDNQYILTGN